MVSFNKGVENMNCRKESLQIVLGKLAMCKKLTLDLCFASYKKLNQSEALKTLTCDWKFKVGWGKNKQSFPRFESQRSPYWSAIVFKDNGIKLMKWGYINLKTD